MLLSIPLAALLLLAAPLQDPDGTKATAVAPLVGEEIAAVVRLDLTKWDAQTFVRRIAGKLADEEDVKGATTTIGAWVDALKKAGAKDLFVLLDLADIRSLPVVVVPLTDGADGKAIAEVLSGGGPKGPIQWPASETILGAVVAGTPDALARIIKARPAARPELALAFAAAGNSSVQVAIIPGTTFRRAIEESMATLPPQLGGGPITTLTQGLQWASLAMTLEPAPALRAIVQAKDSDSAKALQEIAQRALVLLTNQRWNEPNLAALAPVIRELKPQAIGNRVTLDADLEKTAALVGVPIQQARESALRARCVNNLKQIGLAMHNYHDTHNTFPPAFTASREGRPLLSWRVHILPFLDQQKALYDEFHLDEPWDSPHNKALISRMPALYACPSEGRTLAGEGKTSYLTPRGPATIFPGDEAVRASAVTDGTSNTIFVVDASDSLAVIWTKPDDWVIAPEFKTQGLFGHHPGGTYFLMADGFVQYLKDSIEQKLLQAMTTRNGGELIKW
jgi:Protein of unknown function (DUF1559)